MQKINSFMLSALMLAGLCLHAAGQEAEIEVIELEPGVQLKKKIKSKLHRLKKNDDRKRHIITFKADGDENHHEVILSDEDEDHKMIELGDGSKAIIYLNKDGKNKGKANSFQWKSTDGGDFVIYHDDKDEAHQKDGNLWFAGEAPAGFPEGFMQNALKELGGGDWKQFAGNALKHLHGKVEIKIDGHDIDLDELLGSHGLNLARIHDADDIRVHVGKHNIHVPMKMGKGIYNLFHGKKDGKSKSGCNCCCCCCGNKAQVKTSKGGLFRLAPKGGNSKSFFGMQHGNKGEPTLRLKRSPKSPKVQWATPHHKKKPAVGAWSYEAPKAKKSQTLRWATPHKKKAPKSKKLPKSKKGSFYFSDSKSPKAHSKKKGGAYSFGFSPKMGKGEHKSDGGMVILQDVTNEKRHSGKARSRIVGIPHHEDEDEDHHDDDDDDDLEDQIKSLERQVRKLRRELRSLKKKI